MPPKPKCSKEDKALQEVFKMFDKDGKGTISAGEFKDAMKEMKKEDVTDQEVKEILKKFDKDGSGEVDFKEFKGMWYELEMRDAFNAFDEDRSGEITKEELKTVMKNVGANLSDKDLDKMIKEADTSKDGTISFDEFKGMMERANQ